MGNLLHFGKQLLFSLFMNLLWKKKSPLGGFTILEFQSKLDSKSCSITDTHISTLHLSSLSSTWPLSLLLQVLCFSNVFPITGFITSLKKTPSLFALPHPEKSPYSDHYLYYSSPTMLCGLLICIKQSAIHCFPFCHFTHLHMDLHGCLFELMLLSFLITLI